MSAVLRSGRTRIAALATASIAALLLGAAPASAAKPAYRDTRLSFPERAADLVSRMTLAEKAAQLGTSNAAAIPRLGVQEYTYWSEAQHGVSAFWGGNWFGGAESTIPAPVPATSFPTNFAASMSWDPALMRRETDAISDEARGFLDPALFDKADNNLGPSAADYGSLFYFNPTINLARDPRWGRNDEAFGEDPFFVGKLGSAYVDGFQGQTADGRLRGSYLRAVATAKHFALNNVEALRTAISSNTDEATIRDYYTTQFRRVVEDGRVGGLMSSYNAVNGTPAVANSLLLNVLARRTFGLDGYITSDCGGVATTYRGPGPGSALPALPWTCAATTGRRPAGAPTGAASRRSGRARTTAPRSAARPAGRRSRCAPGTTSTARAMTATPSRVRRSAISARASPAARTTSPTSARRSPLARSARM